MNLTGHNPDCRLAAWQLQMKIIDGKKEYRAFCLTCRATSEVTDTEAANRNHAPEVIKVGMPMIELPNE